MYEFHVVAFFVGVAPSAPSQPSSVGTSAATQVTMSWSVSSPVSATSYKLFCMSSSATICSIISSVIGASVTTVASPTNSGTIIGLVPSTTYRCCVQALNAAGSTYSTTYTSIQTAGKSNVCLMISFYIMSWLLLGPTRDLGLASFW